MTAIDKLAWLHVQNRRLLGARSRGKTSWYVPGGKREPGESDAAALMREVFEELSVELVASSIAPLTTVVAQADGKPPGTMVQLTCYRADAVGDPRPSAEIEELRWIGHADRALCSPATQLALDWLRARDLID